VVFDDPNKLSHLLQRVVLPVLGENYVTRVLLHCLFHKSQQVLLVHTRRGVDVRVDLHGGWGVMRDGINDQVDKRNARYFSP